jgi:hypothetical protein
VTAHGAALGLAARRTVLRQTLVPGWAVLASVLAAAQAPSGIRAPVVIVFLCVIPGTALVGLLNPDSFALELSLALAISVALSGLTAGVLVYTHMWSPTAVVLTCATLSLAGGLRDVGFGRVRREAPRLLTLPRLVPAAAVAAKLARRAEVRRRVGAAVAAGGELRRPAGRGLRGVAQARPPRALERPRRARASAPQAPASSLQGFLLDELRQHTASHGSRRRRPPRSLAQLEPAELADLLSGTALQRFVTQRAVQQVDPELWFVDDLERRLRRQALRPRGTLRERAPRGVWITGVSAGRSVPVAWRVLDEEEKPKEWRTRLALEAIDSLPELGLGGAVVAAGTAYGTLAGFRGGLETRGLPYLLRVDAVTAARELAPGRSGRSAAEAREVVWDRIADGGAARMDMQVNGGRAEPELLLMQGSERLVLCEVSATEQASVFWITNLTAAPDRERLASLAQLADRHRVERANDFLLGALEVQAEDGAELQHGLSLVALAQGLRALDSSSAAAEGIVEP